ncbi:MAG: T9SS type A sorting domain-containing protein [Bacteroidetes bacterium SB0662_bin_6]|nr:T9SS type A sorting domain-containing protein [Bacteroidetes bacterium SB0668_bin_1]MYE03637.1 T9SS type A sorting domain-containing protein [Bacteroidetes bacterium SB0662_bin_6]
MKALNKAVRGFVLAAILFFALSLNPGAIQAQSISNVQIETSPASNNTYVAGEVISVNVTYDAGLSVTGSPRLPIIIGDTKRYATFHLDDSLPDFSESAGLLNFDYTVQAGDNDADGISITGSLDLNGGSIQHTSTNANANLALGSYAISNDAGHKVSTPKPEITISTIATSITEGGNIPITVTRNTTSGAASFNVKFTVANGENFGWDTNPAAASGLASFADGSASASLSLPTHNDRLDEPDGTVTISLASGASYTVGTTSSVMVTIQDNEALGDPPVITSTTPGRQKISVSWALPTNLGTVNGVAATHNNLVFVEIYYRGTAPEWDGNDDGTPDTEWKEVFHNSSREDEPIVVNPYPGLEEDTEYEFRMRLSMTQGYTGYSDVVAGRTLTADAPVVSMLEITSDPGDDNTFVPGDEIVIEVRWTSWLEVTGTPLLPIRMGLDGRSDNIKYAVYDPVASYPHGLGQWGILLFKYTVQAGDEDADGITLVDPINANGGTIKKFCAGSSCTDTFANIVFDQSYSIISDPNYKVASPNLSVPIAPDLTAVEVSVNGQNISFRFPASVADPSRAPVTGYRVERSADGNAPWTAITPNLSPANEVIFTEQNVPYGTTRYYRVIALSAYGESAPSVTVSGTVAVPVVRSIAWAGGFTEAAANDGSVTGSVTATLTNDTFTAGVASGENVTVTNLPEGLAVDYALDDDRTILTLTLTGQATAHVDDVNNLTVALADGAFTGGDASNVTNATKSDLAIDFIQPATSQGSDPGPGSGGDGGGTPPTTPTTPTTPTSTEQEEVPAFLKLSGNYPNPFNPQTTIEYALPQAGSVRLSVIDLLGKEVAVLVDGIRQAANHKVQFDGSGLPSGMYLYRLETPERVLVRRMMLLK